MGKDPQEDRSHDCRECGGDGKCPESRKAIMVQFKENPDEFDADLPLEDYMEDCSYCKGDGFIDPDDFEDDGPDPDMARDVAMDQERLGL
jgi:hypothetical protein